MVSSTTIMDDLPLIAITGTTCSGKTGLGIRLAERLKGEIVCADSRTIYRGMTVGTAKPGVDLRQRVRHHLLDVVEPNQTYSAKQFQQDAQLAIAGIRGRGKLPIVVGGSGLYLYGLIYNYSFPAGPRNELRRELELRPIDELVALLKQAGAEYADGIDLNNPRRVIRALETIGQPRDKRTHLPESTLLIGINPPDLTLRDNIAERTNLMFEQELVGEVRTLYDRYGPDMESLRSPGYAEVLDYLSGKITRSQAEVLINQHTWQLARRQRTWFRRNHEIKWVDSPSAGEDLAYAWMGARLGSEV